MLPLLRPEDIDKDFVSEKQLFYLPYYMLPICVIYLKSAVVHELEFAVKHDLYGLWWSFGNQYNIGSVS